MRRLGFILLLSLTGCFSHGGSLPVVDRNLATVDKNSPTLSAIDICSDHGCQKVTTVKLSQATWDGITAGLQERPANAAAEREAVALAVGLFEKAVGGQAGTSVDKGGTMTFPGRRQQDCVDESVNTTRFLTMLQEAGLLHYHKRGWPVHRAFRGGSSHMTATLQEIGGRLWAIDSWFYDNGQPSEVLTVETWLTGWNPPGFQN